MENKAPSTENAIFVDENRQIFRGEKALRLIRERGETKVDARVGMVRVPTERWQEAQRYERRTWMEGRATLTDRNEEHEDFFAGYRPLQGLRFQHAIELGCGPFTNLRKILLRCKCEAIDLLDPLADSYLNHPYCRYRRGRLGGVLSTSLIPFSNVEDSNTPSNSCGTKGRNGLLVDSLVIPSVSTPSPSRILLHLVPLTYAS